MEILEAADIGEIGSIKQFIWRKPPPNPQTFPLATIAGLGYSFYTQSEYILLACFILCFVWFQIRSGTLVEE